MMDKLANKELTEKITKLKGQEKKLEIKLKKGFTDELFRALNIVKQKLEVTRTRKQNNFKRKSHSYTMPKGAILCL